MHVASRFPPLLLYNRTVIVLRILHIYLLYIYGHKIAKDGTERVFKVSGIYITSAITRKESKIICRYGIRLDNNFLQGF